MHTLIIIPKPICECAIGLWTFLVVLSLSESRGLELIDGEGEVELDGVRVDGCET